MEIRPLGSSGLSVTPIGLGLAALGRPAYIDLGRERDLGPERSPEAMQARCHAVLDAAFDAGIRYVDAARSYGDAERFLSTWLAGRGSTVAELTVGSKWGYTYVADWRMDADVHEVKDHSLQTLRRQVGESRALLGSRLALYQIHSATLESGVLEDRGVLEELVRLRGDGLAIGLTTSGARQGETVRRALQVRVAGERPFDVVQATWNPLEPSAGPALAEAKEAGWGVIVKEAVANGRLVPGAPDLPRELDSVAERCGATVDQVAIAAALENPWADMVLSGAVTEGQVRSNAGAAEIGLEPGDLDALAGLAEPPERYWAARSALPWR